MPIKKESDKRESSDSELQTPPPFKKSKSTTSPQSTKWTETEIKKLCDLRKAGMSFPYYTSSAHFLLIYRDMVKHFPARTPKALESCYNRNYKSIGEVFSEEKVNGVISKQGAYE
jgi:serine/threonine-protein kinase RIO1